MRRGIQLAEAIPLAAVLALLPLRADAADPQVDFHARFAPGEARAGEVVILEVRAAVPDGYHLYSMTRVPDGPLRLQIEVAGNALEPVGPWHAPRPAVELDPSFRKHVEYYSGAVTHRRTFKVRGPLPEGGVTVGIRGQICNDRQCIPIRAEAVAALILVEGAPRPERTVPSALEGEVFDDARPAPAGTASALAGGGAKPTDEGLLGFLILAFLAGLAALATPCVFPMIPITVSFFSKYAAVSLRRSVTMALIYAVSIMITFTLVGVIVSAVFGAVGMQWLSSSGGFNLFMTALLVAFALNLFGLFEIRMPTGLIAGASAREQALTSDDGSLAKQAVGVFLMGLVFTLVSFTCTVGFMGFVIAQAAEGQWFYPTVGMLAFSLAFALPFFFLALFPSWADKLRGRGGDWMVAVKACLGFVMLAMSFKFLSNVDLVSQWGLVTRPLVLSVWAGIFLAAALFLLRIFDLPHSDTETRAVGPLRLLFAVLSLALAGYSFTGIRDTRSLGGWFDASLPPAIYPGQEEAPQAGEAGEHLPWIADDIDQGLARAREENRPLFLDLTGYTCSSCRYMEAAILPAPAVRSRLERMVLVKAYTDGNREVHSRQRQFQVERFRTAALPFYAVLNPHDGSTLATHPDKARDADAFAAFLDQGLAAFEAVKPAPAPAAAAVAATVPDAGSEPADAAAAPALAASGPAVDFEFPGLKDGKKVKLSDLRGTWVLVNFWASWCAPCKKELKADFPAALATAPHVRLLTVAFDGDETKTAAVAFADEIGLWKYLVLQGGEDPEEAGLPAAFEASSNLPLTYLIHPAGHIAWMKKGSVHAPELIALLTATTPTPTP
jgi:thiol:disulfide interchange protein DsbD